MFFFCSFFCCVNSFMLGLTLNCASQKWKQLQKCSINTVQNHPLNGTLLKKMWTRSKNLGKGLKIQKMQNIIFCQIFINISLGVLQFYKKEDSHITTDLGKKIDFSK